MKELQQNAENEKWWHSKIVPTKTRQEFYNEYRISEKVFSARLRFYGIKLPPGLILPKEQGWVYEAFGQPPS
jgi:hypothetical protein